MTVTWRVGDFKISQNDSLDVAKFLHHFGLIYGERTAVHHGKVHDYLGIDLYLSTANTLKLS